MLIKYNIPTSSLSAITAVVTSCCISCHKSYKRSPCFSDLLIQSAFDNLFSPLPFCDLSKETSFSSISYSIHISVIQSPTSCFVHVSGNPARKIMEFGETWQINHNNYRCTSTDVLTENRYIRNRFEQTCIFYFLCLGGLLALGFFAMIFPFLRA